MLRLPHVALADAGEGTEIVAEMFVGAARRLVANLALQEGLTRRKETRDRLRRFLLPPRRPERVR